MKVVFFTLVLDGMPWITHHLPMMERLTIPWEWHIVEGAAQPVHCTSWCKPLRPRLSQDGTTEYLDSIARHPCVRVEQRRSWNGKLEMVNFVTTRLKDPCLLWELDADEIWLAAQIETARDGFKSCPDLQAASFYCRYFLGPNILITSRDAYGNKAGTEWRRAWRFEPGRHFVTHEPPELAGVDEACTLSKQAAEGKGLVFDHYAYATRAQVRFKQDYYGYRGAVAGWERLQANGDWPVKVRQFLPWVDDDATADLIHKQL